jgi:hypothetical protein
MDIHDIQLSTMAGDAEMPPNSLFMPSTTKIKNSSAINSHILLMVVLRSQSTATGWSEG